MKLSIFDSELRGETGPAGAPESPVDAGCEAEKNKSRRANEVDAQARWLMDYCERLGIGEDDGEADPPPTLEEVLRAFTARPSPAAKANIPGWAEACELLAREKAAAANAGEASNQLSAPAKATPNVTAKSTSNASPYPARPKLLEEFAPWRPLPMEPPRSWRLLTQIEFLLDSRLAECGLIPPLKPKRAVVLPPRPTGFRVHKIMERMIAREPMVPSWAMWKTEREAEEIMALGADAPCATKCTWEKYPDAEFPPGFPRRPMLSSPNFGKPKSNLVGLTDALAKGSIEFVAHRLGLDKPSAVEAHVDPRPDGGRAPSLQAEGNAEPSRHRPPTDTASPSVILAQARTQGGCPSEDHAELDFAPAPPPPLQQPPWVLAYARMTEGLGEGGGSFEKFGPMTSAPRRAVPSCSDGALPPSGIARDVAPTETTSPSVILAQARTQGGCHTEDHAELDFAPAPPSPLQQPPWVLACARMTEGLGEGGRWRDGVRSLASRRSNRLRLRRDVFRDRRRTAGNFSRALAATAATRPYCSAAITAATRPCCSAGITAATRVCCSAAITAATRPSNSATLTASTRAGVSSATPAPTTPMPTPPLAPLWHLLNGAIFGRVGVV